MDLHILPGVKAKDVADAHMMDTMMEEEHHCKCMTYWIDEVRGHVFCLIDAPHKDVVTELHNKSHGLVPHKIIEVQTSLVEAFLGRVNDPEDAELTDTGLKLINDPGFRIIMVAMAGDQTLLQHSLGKEKAVELNNMLRNLIRQELVNFGGKEVEHKETGLIASFVSAGKAVSCAMAIQEKLYGTEMQDCGLRMGIHAGEPVTNSEKLFGETIQFAKRLCFIANNLQVALSSSVIELVKNENFQTVNNKIRVLSPQDENLLNLIINKLEENLHNPSFNVADCCRHMAMSKSQLYRKILALSGLSPNELFRDYKLEKAKELLKKRQYNISQVTFDTGFSSPSYFTKCFKKKYGILPLAYLDMQ